MNIEEFFELSVGKWFSHRTSQDLAFKKSEGGKSDIMIETLAVEHPDVIKLCQLHEIALGAASCAVRVTWNSTIESDHKKHSGSIVLASVPDVDNPTEGRLLQEMSYADKAPISRRYKMGSDDALTITTVYETMSSEERLWFASPNLRMRASIFKRSGGFSMASFTSEIRLGGSPPAAKASEAANSASS